MSFGFAIANAVAARSAWWACALFVLAGVAVLDDYGVAQDEGIQRHTAIVALDYVWGRSDELLRFENRMYGVAVEAPLLWAERLLGLQDSRAIYLLRHLLTHLLFVTGGLGAAALAFRLYGRRRLALCALGLFLLHPRLYAHSFFNSKDVPFLSLFMLALLLMHWAFRRGTGTAFALCGAGIGALINVRPMGLLLVAGVLGLRACDLAYAADGRARRQVLRTGGLFVAACALTLYALWPYLWSDPVRRLAESLAHMAQAVTSYHQLFRGRYIEIDALPAAYAPVWFAISTPPYALLLGLVGVAALARQVRCRPGALLRHPRVRFEGLALACCALPVLAVILLDSTLYSGWRHLYFIHAPFCVLATGGLHALATSARRCWPAGAGWAYGLAGGGAAATLGAMAFLHPYQQLYFNGLVDRATPERLRTRYDLDYFDVAHRQALEFLLAQYPEAAPLSIHGVEGGRLNWSILPAADRQRIAFVGSGQADFLLTQYRARMRGRSGELVPYAPVIHAQKAYGNTVTAVAAVNLARVEAAVAAPYRAAYRALAARTPVVRADFDVYLDERAVSWVQAPCRQEGPQPGFFLYATPADPQDLPPHQRRAGFDDLGFYFEERGVRFDDACLAVVPRPAYPVRRLILGQWWPDEQRVLWQADIPVPPATDMANAYRAAHRTLAARPPTRRAAFDVYLAASTITFAKAPCAAADTAFPFFVHAAPVHPRALPERSFGNLDFPFHTRGARLDDACLASIPRPAYPVRQLTVGQWLPAEDRALWQADIPLWPATDMANAYRAAHRTLAARPPTRRAAFDVYLAASTITFAKAPCAAADTASRFFVHAVPVNPRALPERPFGNLDFSFDARGVRLDDACLASIPRPAYPVRQLTVGQWLPAEDRRFWQVDIPVPLAPRGVNAYRAAYRALASATPAHRAAFDVHLAANAVALAKKPCTAADTQPRFLLHVLPARIRDLPPTRRRAGFDNRDFEFAWQGAHFDGACLALIPLPDYPVDRLRVGQFRPGEAPLWLAVVPLTR